RQQCMAVGPRRVEAPAGARGGGDGGRSAAKAEPLIPMNAQRMLSSRTIQNTPTVSEPCANPHSTAGLVYFGAMVRKLIQVSFGLLKKSNCGLDAPPPARAPS